VVNPGGWEFGVHMGKRGWMEGHGKFRRGGLAGILLFSVEIFLETLTSIKFLESSIQQSDEVMTEEEYYLCCNFNEINKIQ